jgi:hypothetical protein
MGHGVTAAVKSVFGVAAVMLLDALCGVDLGIVSWAIVATPFIITSIATAIALGLDLEQTAQVKVKETFDLSPNAKTEKEAVVSSLAEQEPVDYPFSSNAPIQN